MYDFLCATTISKNPYKNIIQDCDQKSLQRYSDESASQIKRYIRLTFLIPEILNMVDEKKIAFRPAVEISYLSEDNQYVLLDIM